MKTLSVVTRTTFDPKAKDGFRTVDGLWDVLWGGVKIASVEYVRCGRLEVTAGKLPENIRIDQVEEAHDKAFGPRGSGLPEPAVPLGRKKVQTLQPKGTSEHWWSEDASLVQMSDGEANEILSDWIPYGQEANG